MNKRSVFHLALLLTGMLVFGSVDHLCGQAIIQKGAGQSAGVKLSIDWPLPILPGRAEAGLRNNQIELKNQLIEAKWRIKGSRLQFVRFADLKANQSLDFANIAGFELETASLGKLNAKDFVVITKPELIDLKADLKSPRIAQQLPGKAFRLSLLHKQTGIVIHWQVELRDGSNYIRQLFTISRPRQFSADTLKSIVLFRLPTPYSQNSSIGTVPGSPYAIPLTNFIAAIEQPGYLAVADASNNQVTDLSMPTQLVIDSNSAYHISTMIGCFPLQQRRRTFQYYIERERASRSRVYLHYNSWYDLGEDLSEKKLIAVAKSYEEELVNKRGVSIDGFVLDDGWDNPKAGIWRPDSAKFTDGRFDVLKDDLNDSLGAHLGLWVSPYGGYGGKEMRLTLAKKRGILPKNANNFDLAYPKYYQFFKELCLNFEKRYGVDYFKWDNAAPFENSGRTFGNLKSTEHFMKLCQLAGELHEKNPELFINATVGTWPSPFWLNFVDCTWRMGGPDVSWTGVGNIREQWINYRDGEVYKMVVKRAPLYPLNSMMFHGVVLGHNYQAAKMVDNNNMTNEFRSYFALGTNLQELYLSPDLMNVKAWDDLADCIRWNRKYEKVLIDTHWVQGDPNKGEPYCYGSWSEEVGVLCIRNPDNQPRDISIDILKAFELPEGKVSNYVLTAAYGNQRIQKVEAKIGTPLIIRLQPFEVLVFNANPE